MRKWLLGAIQVAVAAAVAWFVWRQITLHWDEFRSLDLRLELRPGWIALSALTVFVTYAIQIESWRRLLAGWGQALAYRAAGRIWLLANLGRYIPGKVWSVAGMVVMAQQSGVAPWASAASAVAIQAIGLGTAAALIAVTLPDTGSTVRIAAAAALALMTVGALAWKRPMKLLSKLGGLAQEARPLPVGALVVASSLTLASWMTYGLSFWLLARGLGVAGAMTLGEASGIFALGYVMGLLALFAPGGVGVREIAYIGLLGPSAGRAGALALSVGSRILLTVTEVVAPLAVLARGAMDKGKKEPVETARS